MRKAIQFGTVLLLAGALGAAQGQGSSVVIRRDIRVFTVVAALNAAGFDVELAPRYHPVRQRLREHLNDLDPGLASRMREFYALERGEEPDETQLPKYISLALNLTDPPGMELERYGGFIPQDAGEVSGFIPLLNEFFESAEINQLWSDLGPTYDAELDRFAPPLREMVVASDVYLRVPAGATGGRQLSVALELAAPVNSVDIRNYPEGLYMVLGASTLDPTSDVRHAYLHLLLDSLVDSNAQELAEAGRLLELVAGVEGVEDEYVGDSRIFVGESLIRAVELRMEGAEAADAAQAIDRAYRLGLLLVPHFYAALERFEEAESGIREYLPSMIASLSVDAEEERFNERFHTIARTIDERPRAEVPPAPNPVIEVLARARELFNEGDNEAARAEFRRIVDELEPDNGPALYGLALIASREQDAAAARDWFVRAIESETIEPSMRVWAHIYLGRIYDLECDRAAAVDQYSLALEVGDDTRNAVAAARAGIAEPFGSGCGFG